MFVLQLKDETSVSLTIYGNVILLCVLECKARGAQEGRMSVKDINILGEELHHDVCGNMGRSSHT